MRSTPSVDIANVETLIKLGYESFNQQAYEQAIKVWQPMINFCTGKVERRLTDVYLDLGKCYYRTGQYSLARHNLTKALSLYPDDTNLLKLQGFNEEKMQNWTAALAAWQQVLDQHPNHSEAKQHIDAINQQLVPSEPVAAHTVASLSALGTPSTATPSTHVIKPTKASNNSVLLTVEQLEKQLAEVAPWLQQLDADLASQSISPEQADNALHTKLTKHPTNYYLLTRYAEQACDNEAQIARWQRVSVMYPADKRVASTLIQRLTQQHDFLAAKQVWQRYRNANPDCDYQDAAQFAKQAAQEGFAAEAFFRWLAVSRDYTEQMADSTAQLQALGSQLGLQKPSQAPLTVQQQRIVEYQLAGLFAEGKRHFVVKAYLQSAKIWQQAVDLVEDKTLINRDLYLGLGKSYIRSGQLDKAEQSVLAAMAIYPEDYDIAFLYPYIAKQRKDWPKSSERWQQLVEKFPNSVSAKIELAECYSQINQLDLAQQSYEWVIAVDATHFEAHLRLARLLMKKSDMVAALAAWQPVQRQWPDKVNGYLGMAICYKELAEYDQAFSALEVGLQLMPANEALIQEYVRVIERQQDWQTGASRLAALKLKVAATALVDYQLAKLLAKMKQFDQAEEKYHQIMSNYPDFDSVYLGLADLYTEQRKEKDAIDILQQGYTKFGQNQQIVARLINALVTYGEKRAAYDIYINSLKDKHSANNLFKYRNLINEFGTQKITLAKLYADYPQHIDIAVKYANVLLDSYNAAKQRQGIEILQLVKTNNPNLKWINNTLVMGLLKSNREAEAYEVAKTIPATQNDADSLKVRAWLAQKDGQYDESKAYWEHIIKQKHIVSVNGNMGNLTYRGTRPIEVARDEIVMFSSMFNEMVHIPFLLDYYRKLGVTKFFIVDNNSTDGTAEYLLSQPDVYYFWASSSFREAGFGMTWLSHLMDSYAQGNWCVVIDADEYLVYPNMEHKKLPELVQYLDKHGYEALPSFMMAMYPEDVAHQVAIKPGDNLIEKSPYFCNEYFFRGDVHCPYQHVSGGFFYKKNHQTTWCTKTPLIKRNPGIRHIAANHLITSAKVADITSCLLHLKLVGDFEKKAKLNIERKEHTGGGDAYKAYIQLYAGNGRFADVEGTTKFENSQQLVDLELIKNPQGF